MKLWIIYTIRHDVKFVRPFDSLVSIDIYLASIHSNYSESTNLL